MKIAFVSHACVSLFHQEKLKILSGYRDVELFLIVPKWWEEGTRRIDIEYNKNFNIISLPTIFTGRQFIHFYLNLSEYLKKIDPDIIHLEEEPNSAVSFQVLWLKKRLGLRSKVIIFTWQNMFQRWRFPDLRCFFYPFFERYSLANADYLITGNKEGRDIFLKKGFCGHISIIPQFGINPEEFRKMEVGILKQRLGLDKFVIGYLGRLLRMKGIYTLIDAVSRLDHGFKLLIIGNGPEKEKLKDRIKKLGVERDTIFIDGITHREVPLYLNCMDVLVLPSEHTPTWKEQFGRVLVEAMACEVPVIGSNCGEIPNVIGDAGLTFREGDYKELLEKLQLYLTDSSLRREMAKKGRHRVIENFTTEHIAQKTYQIYTEILSATPRRYKKFRLSMVDHFSPSARFSRKFLSKKGKILDLGCGKGNIFYTVSGYIAGIDLDFNVLLKAKEIYEYVIQADAVRLPFLDGTFDYVVSQDLLGHIPHNKKDILLSEIYRVLKKGGKTIHYIETDGKNLLEKLARRYPLLYNRYFIEQDGHYGLEPPSMIMARFKDAGFRVIEERRWAFTFLRFPKEYIKRFDNEYTTSSPLFAAIVDISKVIQRAYILERTAEAVITIISQILERFIPCDNASGMYVCYEK